MPVKVHCGTDLDQRVRQLFGQRDIAVAEVSRFAIPKQVRIRIPQAQSPEYPTVIPLNQRTENIATKDFTSISLGLLGMALKTSIDAGITHWLVIMEPALARLLLRQGMRFEPAGPITNYHGKRQPMLARVDDLLSGIHTARKNFFYLIRHFQETAEDVHQPQIPSQVFQAPFSLKSRNHSAGYRRNRDTDRRLTAP